MGGHPKAFEIMEGMKKGGCVHKNKNARFYVGGIKQTCPGFLFNKCMLYLKWANAKKNPLKLGWSARLAISSNSNCSCLAAGPISCLMPQEDDQKARLGAAHTKGGKGGCAKLPQKQGHCTVWPATRTSIATLTLTFNREVGFFLKRT